MKIENLSKEEMLKINAGESGWYWASYGLRVFSDVFLAPTYTRTPAMG